MAARITTDIEEAAAVLRRGGLAAFATETVYGLGANALDSIAAARIFEAKQRPAFDPLIVHLADPSGLSSLVSSIPDLARPLMERFWPGPLTLVFPRHSSVPDLVTSGLDTIGIRVPDHPQARALIAAAGCPVAAPSANLFGRISPTTAQHVADQLGDRIDVILDGGPCRVGVESTVLDISGPRPVLFRHGGTTLEAIESVIGPVELAASIPAGKAAPAPGMLEKHYAPRTPLAFWDESQPVPQGKIGLLADRFPDRPDLFEVVSVPSPEGDLVTVASRLFAEMRKLDEAGLDLILVTRFPDEGLGRAINDRLRRAAAR